MLKKRSVAEVIILSLVTCGIYFFYWLYAYANDIKTYLKDETINPGLDLVLSIVTCGIYTIYWFYKYGKLMVQCQEQAGVTVEDNAVLYLILAIFGFSIVNVGLMQNSLNKVLEASNIQ